jgi:hypothetical protein
MNHIRVSLTSEPPISGWRVRHDVEYWITLFTKIRYLTSKSKNVHSHLCVSFHVHVLVRLRVSVRGHGDGHVYGILTSELKLNIKRRQHFAYPVQIVPSMSINMDVAIVIWMSTISMFTEINMDREMDTGRDIDTDRYWHGSGHRNELTYLKKKFQTSDCSDIWFICRRNRLKYKYCDSSLLEIRDL